MQASVSSVIVILIVTVYYNQSVVCDVDPSDTNSILLGQLASHQRQLLVQQEQLAIQREQHHLMSQQLELLKSTTKSSGLTILESTLSSVVSSAVLGLVFYAVQILINRRKTTNPEMPQTTRLMDFAVSSTSYQAETAAKQFAREAALRAQDIERLRSALHMKSPASVYFSGETTPDTNE